MNNSICGYCNTEFSGETCPNCGYNISARRPYKNVITDKKYKEQIADTAIAILVNNNLISMKKDLKHLIVKFGYLLLNEKTNELHTLIKVMPPKKMFQKQKVFYLGSQEGKLLLLNEMFTEELYIKTKTRMLTLHQVDLNTINERDYGMELY